MNYQNSNKKEDSGLNYKNKIESIIDKSDIKKTI